MEVAHPKKWTDEEKKTSEKAVVEIITKFRSLPEPFDLTKKDLAEQLAYEEALPPDHPTVCALLDANDPRPVKTFDKVCLLLEGMGYTGFPERVQDNTNDKEDKPEDSKGAPKTADSAGSNAPEASETPSGDAAAAQAAVAAQAAAAAAAQAAEAAAAAGPGTTSVNDALGFGAASNAVVSGAEKLVRGAGEAFNAAGNAGLGAAQKYAESSAERRHFDGLHETAEYATESLAEYRQDINTLTSKIRDCGNDSAWITTPEEKKDLEKSLEEVTRQYCSDLAVAGEILEHPDLDSQYKADMEAEIGLAEAVVDDLKDVSPTISDELEQRIAKLAKKIAEMITSLFATKENDAEPSMG
jgi:hypothetical protein